MSGDGASPPVPTDHSLDLSQLAAAAAELDAVEAALARLEDGTFEQCQVCGGPISRASFREDPLVTRCEAHAAQPGT